MAYPLPAVIVIEPSTERLLPSQLNLSPKLNFPPLSKKNGVFELPCVPVPWYKEPVVSVVPPIFPPSNRTLEPVIWPVLPSRINGDVISTVIEPPSPVWPDVEQK